LVFALFGALASAAVVKLPGYNVNTTGTTVSGLSSGAFFAVQMHVAFSSLIQGAGVFAGGPYDCAEGSVSVAEDTCMYAIGLNPNKYISTTNSRSGVSIDTVDNLKDDKIYMFSGTKDTTVSPKTMDALQTYYEAFLPKTSIVYINNMVAAHTFPSDDPVNINPCTLSISPYISNCEYDGSGKALQQLLGQLTPRNNGTLGGTIINFDQTEFLGAGHSFASNGYAFIPQNCAAGQRCQLHVAFHGCVQSYQSVGMDFVEHTGYNKWADVNNIIVVYPQTIKSEFAPSNPEGCWDWWGYDSDAKTYDEKTGPQMAAVKAIIDRIGSGLKA